MANVSVLIPTSLRNYTSGEDTVKVDAGNLGAAVEALITAYPEMGSRLRNAQGALNRYLNIYINEEDIRFLENEETVLKDGDQVSIVPAVAGGKG